MAAPILTQVALEYILVGQPDASITQEVLEIVKFPDDTQAQLTTQILEIVKFPSNDAKMTQCVLEVVLPRFRNYAFTGYNWAHSFRI
jgi:hypothetical protein